MDTFFVFRTPFLGKLFFGKNMFLFKSKKNKFFFFKKKSPQKRCPKNKKSVHKKKFPKKMGKIFKKKTKTSYHLRANKVFVFFKKKLFFSKNKKGL
jgi:hypothetical protein